MTLEERILLNMLNTGLLRIIMAFVPILWLLFSLGKLKMPAFRASLIALTITASIALAVFAMPAISVVEASVEGFMLALFPILWVIVSALFVYNITVETGSMDKIKKMLAGISPDRRIQGLILAFGFGGFLEAVAGFGTAVAIPAGILSAMGFHPLMAATVCLIANTIPVAFGVLGVPVVTLAQVTFLSLDKLSLYTALQLIPFVVFLPLVIVFVITGSFKNIKGIAGVSIASGVAFAAGQTGMAVFVGPELAAVVGSIASLAVIILWLKMMPAKNIWLFKGEEVSRTYANDAVNLQDAIRAWSPYMLILLIILATRFIPFLDFLNQYPFVLKQQFYYGQGGKAMVFQLATSGGTILFISAVLGGLINRASLKHISRILVKTLKQVNRTIITVLSIVALAKVMGYSGMVTLIAGTFASVSGKLFPVISPFIGALGTFLTGSDTSSNVLFGGLQKQTALQLGMNEEWLTAANASGATAGKMISPQSISIATAATGLSGKEGNILGTTMKYCLIYVLLMGILVFVFQTA